MRWTPIFRALLLMFLLTSGPFLFAQKKSSSHLIVSFPSGDKMLLGYLYRPEGEGRFPAVIFNHGNHKGLTSNSASEYESLGKFFTSNGYLLFVPDRQLQFLPGDFSPGLEQKLQNNPTDQQTKDQRMVEILSLINRDVIASIEWLKKQPDVETNRIAMAGLYAGGVQTIVTSEKNPGLRAYIPFFPGITTWKDSYVFQGLMSSAVRKAKAPLFLIFAKNNQDLDPADVLGGDLQKKGKPNRTKIYPPFGKPDEFARYFVRDGNHIWGPDVLEFLDETMK